MDSMLFTAGHVHPHLDVWGNRQTFAFDQHTSSLTLHNTFQPIQTMPALLNLEFMNVNRNGFRLQHQTAPGDSFGSLELSTFLNGQGTGTPFVTVGQPGFVFHVATKGLEPITPPDFSTKNYVDSTSVKSVTAGTGLSGGTISSPLNPNGTLAIAPTGVMPGTYSWPEFLAINAQGQVTYAYNGRQPVLGIGAGSGISVYPSGSNPYPLISLTFTGVSPGVYSMMSAEVDAFGRITSASSNSPPPPPYLNNLPINGNVSLLSYDLTTSGNINATTGTLMANNLAAYNSIAILCQSPISLNNNTIFNVADPLNPQDVATKNYVDTSGGNLTLPINLSTSSPADGINLNNDNASAYATGYSVSNNGTLAVEFGFNNSTNEAYVWAYGNASLKFGTNGIKRMAIEGDGSLTMNGYKVIDENGFLMPDRIYGFPATRYPFCGVLSGDGNWHVPVWPSQLQERDEKIAELAEKLSLLEAQISKISLKERG